MQIVGVTGFRGLWAFSGERRVKTPKVPAYLYAYQPAVDRFKSYGR